MLFPDGAGGWSEDERSLGPLPRAVPHQAGGFPGHAARPDEPGPLLVESALLDRLPRDPQGAGDRLRRAGPSRGDQAVDLCRQPAGLPALGRASAGTRRRPCSDCSAGLRSRSAWRPSSNKRSFMEVKMKTKIMLAAGPGRGGGPRRDGPSGGRAGGQGSRHGRRRYGAAPGRVPRRRPPRPRP